MKKTDERRIEGNTPSRVDGQLEDKRAPQTPKGAETRTTAAPRTRRKPSPAHIGQLEAYDQVSVACCALNERGLVLEANHAAAALLGTTDEALVNHPISHFFVKADEEICRLCLQQALESGIRQTCELGIRRGQGAACWVRAEVLPAREENGISVLRVVLSDISACRRVEEALRESQQRLANTLQAAQMGAWEWNLVTDDLDWSDQTFGIFRLSPQSVPMTRARFLERVHPDDGQLVIDRANRALLRLESYALQYRIVTPDSEVRVVRDQGDVEFGESDVPVRMFGTFLDITERVQTQEDILRRHQQLIQADKMVSLGILAAGVAHEINNPNHAIMSSVNALTGVWESARPILDRFHENFGDFVLGGFEYSEYRDKVPDMIAGALSNSRRIALIVDELRDFARHSPKEDMSAVNLSAVVKSAIVLTGNMVKRCTNHFSVSGDQAVPQVLGNFQRIEQVVINLIQNACQSLPSRERSVRVATRRDPVSGAALIVVCDEGVGIPKHNRDKLGTPFFTTKGSAEGMGLGLWTCFNIVQEHGGMLTFSDRKCGGTQAVLALPVADPDNPGDTDWRAL